MLYPLSYGRDGAIMSAARGRPQGLRLDSPSPAGAAHDAGEDAQLAVLILLAARSARALA